MSGETPFRVFLTTVSLIQIGVSHFYMKRAKVSSTIFRRREEGIVLSVSIVLAYLAYGLAVVTYLLHPGWMEWSAVVIPSAIRWMGTVPTILGAVLIVWSLRHLGKNLTISISTTQQHTLITSGPYGFVRHPMYSGGMVESVGVCLLTANWFVLLASSTFWAMVVWRTPLEENKLNDKFANAYNAYQKRTGRFVPRLFRGSRHRPDRT